MSLSPTPVPDSAAAPETAPLHRTPLHEGWTLEVLSSEADLPDGIAGRSFAATVPSCVHTDLMAADALADPFPDRNDELQHWIGRTAWRYTCRFKHDAAISPGHRLDLVCEGLDTIATLRLNGREIGRSENMHVTNRFDIAEAVRPGDNTLEIDFVAPLPFAEAMQARHGAMPFVGNGSNPPLPHNMMRKMACNFGWDWGPALVTSGIWRPIHLEAWAGPRIAGVRPLVRQAEADRAVVEVHVDLEAADNASDAVVRVELIGPDGEAVIQTTAPLRGLTNDQPVTLTIRDPQRWWPVGYGDQPLYRLGVKLRDGGGNALQTWTRRIGLRTSRLVTDPDPTPCALGQGSTFHLEVNGQRVYCKGANWIPDDTFPSRITPQRYRHQVQSARDANMNMLRVWGGGIYEDDAFYDACDELGVMVWQDFLCACACYHEHEPYRSWFEAEARDNVARLSSHASLVLWNGCNENVLGVHAWGDDWRALRQQGKPWGLHYYLELFPEVLRELDPVKPYWPASPYAGDPDVDPNTEAHGNCHIWDVWNGQGDARNYLSHYPRFASEFGFHGPPTWATIERSIPEDQRHYDSPAMVHHNRHAGGQALANERMADYFDPPADFDDWLYLAQVVQARSLALGVEWFRALSPWNSGALYWQFNDCWPVASWSAVDGDHRRKPLWFATRRFLADRLVTIRPAQVTPIGAPFGPLAVYLHNDHADAWAGPLKVAIHRVDQERTRPVLAESITAPRRGLARLDLPADLPLQPDEFLVATLGDARALWFPHPDRTVPYARAEFNAGVERVRNGYRVTIEAKTLVRDLCLFADRLDPDATVSDQLITLLPGESAVIDVRTTRDLDADTLVALPVLQCVNRFGA